MNKIIINLHTQKIKVLESLITISKGTFLIDLKFPILHQRVNFKSLNTNSGRLSGI